MTDIYRSTGAKIGTITQGTADFLGLSNPSTSTLLQVSSAGVISASNNFTGNSAPEMAGTIMSLAPSNNGFGNFRIAALMNPSGYYGNHNYSALGTSGINTASGGLSLVTDRVYLFPVMTPYIFNGITKIKFGVSTADASGTADIEAALYRSVWNDGGAGVAAGAVIFSRPMSSVTLSNISTTGLKSITITSANSTMPGGYFWVALRAASVGTSLVLSEPHQTDPMRMVEFFGLQDPEVNTPIYGIYFSSQTSLPANFFGVPIDGFITTPVGVCVSET